eukprot:gene15819-7129_t
MQQAKKSVSMNAFTLESLHYDVLDLVSMQRKDSDIQQVINYKSSTGAEKGVVPAAYKTHVQKLFIDEEDNLLKFCYHGDPAFESELFQTWMKKRGLSKVRTTGYNPRSNGLTEQSNVIVKDYLTANVNGKSNNRRDWDTWTRELAFAYKQFSEQLSSMYELARQRMNTRQKVSASYYDKKITDDNQQRVAKSLKSNGTGHNKIVVAAHPVYYVKVNWNNVKTKCLTRDKLRRVGKKKLGGSDETVAATPSNSDEIISDRGNVQREEAETPNNSGETIPDRGSVQGQPSNSDETISDRGHVVDEVNFDSEDSDEELSEGEEDVQVDERRGRGRYNLRPNPELARWYEGYLAQYLTVC